MKFAARHQFATFFAEGFEVIVVSMRMGVEMPCLSCMDLANKLTIDEDAQAVA